MCSVHALFTSAIARMGEDEDVAEELLTFEFVEWFYPLSLKANASPKHRTRKEHRVYQKLSQLVPRLSERLMAANEEDIMVMAELVRLLPKSFRNVFIYKRFKRAYLLQGPTIPKV
jgi:hypothetical protein